MMNGCICCTCAHASNPHLAGRAPARLATQRARLALDRVRQDLVVVLNKLAKRQASGKLKLDGIIIETTGMADPAPVAQTFLIDPEIEKLYDAEHAKVLQMRRLAGQKGRQIAALQRQVDEIPNRAELLQYERRFRELYAMIAQKGDETRKYYAMYNVLEEKKSCGKTTGLIQKSGAAWQSACVRPSSSVRLRGMASTH